MQKKTQNYCFTIDTLSISECSGWYMRYDGKEKTLCVIINEKEIRINASNERHDVANTGLGDVFCGFFFQFNPKLNNKDKIIFKDTDGNILHRETILLKQYKKDEINEKIMHLIEPFVELDIKKVQQKLMTDNICKQYEKLFAESLEYKTNGDLRKELVHILAEMKTTLHLLSAAYLDYTRYKDPDFLKNIFTLDYPSNHHLVLDMRGDITGSNWYPAEQDGRWAGPLAQSSLLLPNLAPGTYQIEIKIVGEITSGSVDALHLFINEEPISLIRETSTLPSTLTGTFILKNSEEPFLTLLFDYRGEIHSPSEILNSEYRDTRKLSFRISTITFRKDVL